jgi:hypothetical protein
MSLLQEMQQHGLADCEFNRTLTGDQTMKTNELTNAALDWAVAKCEFGGCEDWDGTLEGVDAISDMQGGTFNPSTDWEQGGAIIEREMITVECFYEESIWHAWTPAPEQPRDAHGYGETPLIAAMRCYVASKLGDEVEVPDELIDYA